MIHIVFEPANAEALKKSFELDDTLAGEILVIQDDYAVGPLQPEFNDEAEHARQQWWKDILKDTPFEALTEDGHVHDGQDVAELKQKLNADAGEEVWIWAAQNKHDVSGYYWLMSQLKSFQGRIYILYLNNLPFINEKGSIFYPTSLFQIPPKEFLKAKKLARLITPSEFEVDPDEWIRLANENGGVRLLEGGKKLMQKDYDYYDQELLKYITKDWQKVSKMFQQFFAKAKETTGDAYLFWRLRLLAELQIVELRGNPKSLKELEVKLHSEEVG